MNLQVIGNNALWPSEDTANLDDERLIDDYADSLLPENDRDKESFQERFLAPVAISILPQHISYFSESKETNRKAPGNLAARDGRNSR